jgi:hypothetical protein
MTYARRPISGPPPGRCPSRREVTHSEMRPVCIDGSPRIYAGEERFSKNLACLPLSSSQIPSRLTIQPSGPQRTRAVSG